MGYWKSNTLSSYTIHMIAGSVILLVVDERNQLLVGGRIKGNAHSKCTQCVNGTICRNTK